MPSTFNVRYQDTENGRWVQIGIKSTQNPDDYLYSEEDEYQLTERQRTAQYLALIHHEIIPKIVEATDYWPRMDEMLRSGTPYRVYVQGEDVSLRGGVSGKINLYCLQNEAEAHYTTVFTLKPKFEVYNENFKKIRDVALDDPVFLVRINWLERSELYTTVMSAKDSDQITEDAQKDITEYYKNNPVFPKVRTLPDEDEGEAVPLKGGSPLARPVATDDPPPENASPGGLDQSGADHARAVPETGELAEGSDDVAGASATIPPKVEPPPKRWVYGYDGFEPPPEMRKAMEENIRASKRRTETTQSIPPAISEMLKSVAQLGNMGPSTFSGPGVTVTTSVAGDQVGPGHALHMPFPTEAFSPENFPQAATPVESAQGLAPPTPSQQARHAWATQQAGIGQSSPASAPTGQTPSLDAAARASAAAQRVWAAQQASAPAPVPAPVPAPAPGPIPDLPAGLAAPSVEKTTTEQYLDWIKKRNQGRQ